MFDNKMTLPVIILSVTLVLMMSFQLRQLSADRTLLKQSLAQQESQLKQAEQVGAQFESLSVGTARLAGEGNQTAQAIIAEMKKIGINVNPNATPGQKAIERVAPAAAAPAEGKDAAKPAAPTPSTTTPSTPQTPAAPAAVGN